MGGFIDGPLTQRRYLWPLQKYRILKFSWVTALIFRVTWPMTWRHQSCDVTIRVTKESFPTDAMPLSHTVTKISTEYWKRSLNVGFFYHRWPFNFIVRSRSVKLNRKNGNNFFCFLGMVRTPIECWSKTNMQILWDLNLLHWLLHYKIRHK